MSSEKVKPQRPFDSHYLLSTTISPLGREREEAICELENSKSHSCLLTLLLVTHIDSEILVNTDHLNIFNV
jgi:hypothetical protein